MKSLKIDKREFKKSSFSPIFKSASPLCVGVSISELDVLVANTAHRFPVLRFTREEWDAFIKGVKAGEFDMT